jgi:hypothetical protein
MSNVLRKVQRAISTEKGCEKMYKDAKSNLIHLLGMFNEWKTQTLILPETPYVVSPLFIKSMLCFIHGCHTLKVSEKMEGKAATVAYTTAMQSFGEVWPRHPYGNIAMHHYLVSRVLLYNEIHNSLEEASDKLTCLKEIERLLPYIKFQECFLTNNVLDLMKDIEKGNINRVDDLVNTHYAVEKSLNDITIPQGYKLTVCHKTGNFGCKCKE